jgi:hypothetical protein
VLATRTSIDGGACRVSASAGSQFGTSSSGASPPSNSRRRRAGTTASVGYEAPASRGTVALCVRRCRPGLFKRPLGLTPAVEGRPGATTRPSARSRTRSTTRFLVFEERAVRYVLPRARYQVVEERRPCRRCAASRVTACGSVSTADPGAGGTAGGVGTATAETSGPARNQASGTRGWGRSERWWCWFERVSRGQPRRGNGQWRRGAADEATCCSGGRRRAHVVTPHRPQC